MKHIKHLLFLSILCSLVLFNACSEDEDPVTDTPTNTTDDDGSGDNNGNITIGNAYQGGIIAYLFQEGDIGYIAGEIHGLIAATEDQTTADGVERGCYNTEGSSVITGAEGTAIGTGAQNTLDILADCSEDGIPAKLASDYEVTVDGDTYDDWFLPSKDELNKLYLQRDVVGGFAYNSYWSSSEFGNSNAWLQSFDSGNQFYNASPNGTNRVRAVRAF